MTTSLLAALVVALLATPAEAILFMGVSESSATTTTTTTTTLPANPVIDSATCHCGTSVGAATTTYAHTTGTQANMKMVVVTALFDGDGDIACPNDASPPPAAASTAAYNGDALTYVSDAAGYRKVANTDPDLCESVQYIDNPDQGTNNVVITHTEDDDGPLSVVSCAVTMWNVQSGAPDASGAGSNQTGTDSGYSNVTYEVGDLLLTFQAISINEDPAEDTTPVAITELAEQLNCAAGGSTISATVGYGLPAAGATNNPAYTFSSAEHVSWFGEFNIAP